MGRFVKGDVVVVPFPFTDFIQSKRRPALVVANLTGDDIILCQITSQAIKDNYAIKITNKNFKEGNLNQESNVRPNRIFTTDEHIILYKIGSLKEDITSDVIEKIIKILTS